MTEYEPRRAQLWANEETSADLCLALVLSYLDWATGIKDEAHQVSAEEFDRAALFVTSYALPPVYFSG